MAFLPRAGSASRTLALSAGQVLDLGDVALSRGGGHP